MSRFKPESIFVIHALAATAANGALWILSAPSSKGSKVAAAADLPKAISVSTIWSRLSCRAKPSRTKPRGRRKHLKLAQKFPK